MIFRVLRFCRVQANTNTKMQRWVRAEITTCFGLNRLFLNTQQRLKYPIFTIFREYINKWQLFSNSYVKQKRIDAFYFVLKSLLFRNQHAPVIPIFTLSL